jgi:hypothetical protein
MTKRYTRRNSLGDRQRVERWSKNRLTERCSGCGHFCAMHDQSGECRAPHCMCSQPTQSRSDVPSVRTVPARARRKDHADGRV